MAFQASSQDISLDGAVLKAFCKNKFGGLVPSELDLNAVLGSTDGDLVWGLTGFQGSARNISLSGTILHAEVQKHDGSWTDDTFDLAAVVSNVNGKLEAINVPAIVAVPTGEALQVAINQFGDALRNNPGWKVQYAVEPDGSTLWYVNAQAENKTDTFFKTYSADTRASFMHTVQSSGRPIEQVNVDVFSAYAGAEVQYVEIGGEKFGTYAGVGAELNLFKADASVFDLKLGIGVETGAGIKNGSLDVKVAGCGATIGKRVSISVLGNEFGLDFGKFFD